MYPMFTPEYSSHTTNFSNMPTCCVAWCIANEDDRLSLPDLTFTRVSHDPKKRRKILDFFSK